MSDQVNVGDYSLEISGDEVLVRDESGAIVESVELDEIEGELTLPDGRTVDLASIFADGSLDAFETAAGPANDNTGFIDGSTGTFKAFRGAQNAFDGLDSTGTLGATSLPFGALNTQEKQSFDAEDEETPVLVTWSSHDHWRITENELGGSFGRLVEGNPADYRFKVSDDRFEIVDGVLQARNGAHFDHEAEPGIDIEITATSRTGDEQSLSLHIEVTDVNEAPTDLFIDGDAANENVFGAVIGTLTVADPDQHDAHSFEVSDDRFEVVNGQLKLKDGVSLDHESEPTVEVTVIATDKGGHQIERAFTINVGDVNEAPADIGLSGNALVENVAGAVVGTLSDIDPDASDDVSFDVSDSRFEVVNGQLKLKDGISLDFEIEPSLDVVVTATDSAGNKVQETFSLSIGDVNEAQTALSLDQAAVSENTAGAIVGAVTVADPDAGDSQGFQVSDNRFEVVNGYLKLKDGISLNHESEPTVDVQVIATDGAGHQIQQTFTITVGDVNEAPLGLTLTTDSAQLVLNGSFEADKLNPGQWQLFDGIAGWKTDTQVEIQNNVTNKASHGAQLVEIDADKGVDTIYQDVKTTAGQVYELTFDTATRKDTKHTDTIEVYWNGVKIGSVDPHSTAWQTSAFQVVGTGGNDRLEFRETGGNNDNYGGLLDNVSLTGMGATIAENFSGAVIGTLQVSDPDAGDSHAFSVSDSRFEVVDGQLRLKADASLDHEAEPSVDVTVTATDGAGHTIQQAFTITVANVNEAPVVQAAGGTVVNHVVDTSESYDPQASKSAGDYLYGTKGASLSAADISSGISTENLTLFAPTDVTVTFQKEGAGHRNMVGVYQFDDSGNIIPGSVAFIWLDATASTENKIGATLGKDFLGHSQSSTVSLGTMPEGTHLGFFTIANGAGDNANKALLADATAGTGSQAAAMDAIAGQLSIKVDANGNGRVYIGDTALNGDTYFTHSKVLNTDFSSGKDINHAVAGVSDKLPGELLIGFEDLNGGGDKDYNDLVFSVGMGTYNVNKMTQSAVQPTVDFSDVDSGVLSQAVIVTSGFQAGDTLNVPPSGEFDVTVDQSGADLTITIVGKTGTETLDQYEDFANAIYFSSSSKVEGARHLSYSVTDGGGLVSNVSSADINVTNSHELSSSQLGNGKTILGSGDDVLHINTSNIGPTDLGDGYDTVHLAKHGMSFGHNEAVKLGNAEAIDATGYGANNVALSIHDVLNMSDSDHRLTIIGDAGDSVTLTGNGNHHWAVVESNAEFTTYAYSDATMQAVVEISNQLNAQVS